MRQIFLYLYYCFFGICICVLVFAELMQSLYVAAISLYLVPMSVSRKSRNTLGAAALIQGWEKCHNNNRTQRIYNCDHNNNNWHQRCMQHQRYFHPFSSTSFTRFGTLFWHFIVAAFFWDTFCQDTFYDLSVSYLISFKCLLFENIAAKSKGLWKSLVVHICQFVTHH